MIEAVTVFGLRLVVTVVGAVGGEFGETLRVFVEMDFLPVTVTVTVGAKVRGDTIGPPPALEIKPVRAC